MAYYKPTCDHCNEPIEGAWHRPRYLEVWLCWDCNDRDLATYDVPDDVNGWYLAPFDGRFEYRNDENTGLIYYEEHADGKLTAYAQGDATGVDRLGLFETEIEVLASMKRFMRATEPSGYGVVS